jgi:hypothetical protein
MCEVRTVLIQLRVNSEKVLRTVDIGRPLQALALSLRSFLSCAALVFLGGHCPFLIGYFLGTDPVRVSSDMCLSVFDVSITYKEIDTSRLISGNWLT